MDKEYRVTIPLGGSTRTGKEPHIGVLLERELSITRTLGLLVYSFHTDYHKGD